MPSTSVNVTLMFSPFTRPVLHPLGFHAPNASVEELDCAKCSPRTTQTRATTIISGLTCRASFTTVTAEMNSQSTELVLFLRGDATAREDGSSL